MEETISGIVADLEGKVVAYGKGAEKIFGYTREEILGKHVAVFHPEGSDTLLEELFKTAMDSGFWEKDTTLVRKNGEKFPARLKVTAVKDSEGKITGLTGVTQDLSNK